MSFQVLHKFEHNGKIYSFVPDEEYETRGSFAYDGFVIVAQIQQLYWSNEMGWVDFPLATRFTREERTRLDLPLGGTWLDETTAAENEEIGKLQSGEWVVLGCIVSEPCKGVLPVKDKALHCECCSGSHEIDSLWGIVLENDQRAWEKFVTDGGI